MWSPLGTYLTTFHDLGVALWGGPSWTQVCKLEHITARLVDYSPNEKYIATWSQFPISRVPNDSHVSIRRISLCSTCDDIQRRGVS